MRDDEINDNAAAENELYGIAGLYGMLDEVEEFTNRVGRRLEAAKPASNRDASRRHCHYGKPGPRYRLQ